MPLAVLLISSQPARLTEATTRPYFLQSLTLFLACRRIPDPPTGAAAQIKDLETWALV